MKYLFQLCCGKCISACKSQNILIQRHKWDSEHSQLIFSASTWYIYKVILLYYCTVYCITVHIRNRQNTQGKKEYRGHSESYPEWEWSPDSWYRMSISIGVICPNLMAAWTNSSTMRQRQEEMMMMKTQKWDFSHCGVIKSSKSNRECKG